MSRRKSFGFSFSLNRLLGITSFKQKIARETGIPLTEVGRERKLGRMLSKGLGCGVVLLATACLPLLALVAACGPSQANREERARILKDMSKIEERQSELAIQRALIGDPDLTATWDRLSGEKQPKKVTSKQAVLGPDVAAALKSLNTDKSPKDDRAELKKIKQESDELSKRWHELKRKADALDTKW